MFARFGAKLDGGQKCCRHFLRSAILMWRLFINAVFVTVRGNIKNHDSRHCTWESPTGGPSR